VRSGLVMATCLPVHSTGMLRTPNAARKMPDSIAFWNRGLVEWLASYSPSC